MRRSGHCERVRVTRPHPEREIMIRSKNALRHGNCFAQQRLGFFEAIYPHKGVRVVVGCNESSFMFFAVELQTSGSRPPASPRNLCAMRTFWCANAPP